MGFKHVGKSVIGKEIAKKLHKTFVDLDRKIEAIYEAEHHKKTSCRQIMLKEGQDYFRELEHRALLELSHLKPSVISLGGGTPLYEKNQVLMKGHCIVHVTAPKAVTFERIMMHGRPAFFSPDENVLETFNRLWSERDKIYKSLSMITVKNDRSIKEAAVEIITKYGQHYG